MKHRKTINICDKACFTALLRLDSYNSGQDSCPSPVPSQASFFCLVFIVLVVPKFTIITLVKAHVQVQFLRRQVFLVWFLLFLLCLSSQS